MPKALVLFAGTPGQTAKVAARVAKVLVSDRVSEYDFATRLIMRLRMKRGGHPADVHGDCVIGRNGKRLVIRSPEGEEFGGSGEYIEIEQRTPGRGVQALASRRLAGVLRQSRPGTRRRHQWPDRP
jgi:hypothetical protein